jgi:hypothetical protein
MAGLEDVRPGQQGGGGARQGAVGRHDQVPWDTTATTGGAAAPGLTSGALAPGMAWSCRHLAGQA